MRTIYTRDWKKGSVQNFQEVNGYNKTIRTKIRTHVQINQSIITKVSVITENTKNSTKIISFWFFFHAVYDDGATLMT